MAIAGEVAVNVTAQTSKFEKGMKRSRDQLKGFNSSAKSTKAVIGGLSKSFAALGVTVGAGLLVRSFKQIANEIEDIGLVSQKLDILPNALVGLRHEASKVGVATQTLDMALQRMTRRLAEAAKGTGEAKDILKELNLNAAELSRMQPDKAFALIKTAVEGLEDQGQQVRAFFKIFDSEGVPLVNLSADAIGTAAQKAKELGLAVSDQDVKRISQFQSAWVDTVGTLKGATQKLVIDIAPAAISAVNALSKILNYSIEQGRGTKPHRRPLGFLPSVEDNLAALELMGIAQTRSRPETASEQVQRRLLIHRLRRQRPTEEPEGYYRGLTSGFEPFRFGGQYRPSEEVETMFDVGRATEQRAMAAARSRAQIAETSRKVVRQGLDGIENVAEKQLEVQTKALKIATDTFWKISLMQQGFDVDFASIGQ